MSKIVQVSYEVEIDTDDEQEALDVAKKHTFLIINISHIKSANNEVVVDLKR